MNDEASNREILQAVETDAVYFLRIDYEDGDSGSAIGHVFKVSDTRQLGLVPTQVLATNDPLRKMWASPSGHLWVGGASGTIGTTAPVQWPAPSPEVGFLTLGGSPAWTATDLPRARQTGLQPNVTALWGTGDTDVYAGTYDGDIYRWDGTAWQQVFEGPADGSATINDFGGVAADIYALGNNATILHFNGRDWRRLFVPGPSNGHESFKGVIRNENGDVLIAGSGDAGRLLSGSAAGGFEEFGRYSSFLIDMAPLGERILFAIGTGVGELFGRDINTIKSTFRTAAMSHGSGRLFFFEPAPEGPRFIEYDPRNEAAPWWRIAYY